MRKWAIQHLVSEAVVRVAQNREEKADLDRERIHLKSEIETLQVEYGAFDFGVDEAHQPSSGPSIIYLGLGGC
ncbi:MAG: hypothetical protein ABW170_07855 [Candidatus Thiodiazotropha sp. L084R]